MYSGFYDAKSDADARVFSEGSLYCIRGPHFVEVQSHKYTKKQPATPVHLVASKVVARQVVSPVHTHDLRDKQAPPPTMSTIFVPRVHSSVAVQAFQ